MAVLRRMRQGYRAASAVCLIASAVAFYSSSQFAALKLAFNYWDPLAITEFRLNQLSTNDFITEIEASLAEDDIAEAGNLVALAQERGHEIPSELVEKSKESVFQYGLRNIKDFINGATTGEATSATAIGGALAADYVGVGDVRDAVIQGGYLIQGQDYDKITLGLSLVGLATVIPGTGAVDIGASVVKTANKAGKLSKPLRNRVGKLASEMVDVTALRKGLSEVKLPTFRTPAIREVRSTVSNLKWSDVMKGDFSGFGALIKSMMPIDVDAAKMSFKGAIKPNVASEVGSLVSNATVITKVGGVKTTFRVLEHADDAKDLSRFTKLTSKYGEQTSAVVKILGKTAIKLGKLAYWLAAVMIGILGWVLWAAWLLFSMTRGTSRLFARKAG
ncbi:transcriptional regulator (plasmid) [Brucella intermedia]|uniref:transcriptional regulator n=1 Tax=Brucella intermedia TaxID=94625 RepID=UPI002733D8CB|nr:transcriptional regulator [Brucella intermedia]WLF99790.1 transcriptional regulator [Brucella intermedia]